jgi:hypothetical protein
MCRASSKGRTRLLLEESMASCRRTLGEPKQNTGHWERQVTAVGPSQTKLVRHNHKCRRIPGPAATSSILRSSNSPISINCGRPSAARKEDGRSL